MGGAYYKGRGVHLAYISTLYIGFFNTLQRFLIFSSSLLIRDGGLEHDGCRRRWRHLAFGAGLFQQRDSVRCYPSGRMDALPGSPSGQSRSRGTKIYVAPCIMWAACFNYDTLSVFPGYIDNH